MPRNKRWQQPMTNHELKEATTLKPLHHWSKAPLAYEYNYGYAMNYYQPMIEYLDAKARGGKPPVPHLPYTNERALDKYRPSNAVHGYSTRDLKALENHAEKQAMERLKSANSFQIASNGSSHHNHKAAAAFSLSKSYSSASMTKQVFTQIKKTTTSKESSHQSGLQRSISMGNMTKCDHLDSDLWHHNARNVREHRVADDDFIVTKHERNRKIEDTHNLKKSTIDLRAEFKSFDKRTNQYLEEKSKQMSIEIEQLNSRVVEAETKLKTEVTRIKKKLQIQITELEMSLDVANKSNIELQKTIKKQSLQLTEIQAHYDEVHRQLQVTSDQYGQAQRRVQSLTAELEEIRGNYEQALRHKRSAEQQYEEATTRISELTIINVNLSSSKSKLEQELATLGSDYDEVTKELRIADERFQRVQVELKHAVETLHEEQERVVKIESIKKSLEIEVKNLSIRLEEVEANAIVGGKRVISKLEARIRDIELELDEEKRRHAETIKILRKKERHVKEVIMQSEEDQKTMALLQESCDKANSKISLFKRQLQETEGMTQQSVTRVRRFQRELEAAEDRADTAESSLSLIRAKHRTFVTSSNVPGSQVYLVQETTRSSSTELI